MRKHNCFGHGHAQLARKRVVEELIVCAPPERIVDHNRSAQGGILQIGPIEVDVVRDAVDNDSITARVLPSSLPPIRICSAITSGIPLLLIRSTSAEGKVFSIP